MSVKRRVEAVHLAATTARLMPFFLVLRCDHDIMTRAMRPLPIPLPLGSLLPPSGVSPSQALPRSLAVLGPLPPTTPIHLALNYLYLSDLPDFDHNAHEPGNGRPKEKDRVLIITGPEDSSKHAIKEDDEDYLRERGGDYTFLERLRRVDIRCAAA